MKLWQHNRLAPPALLLIAAGLVRCEPSPPTPGFFFPNSGIADPGTRFILETPEVRAAFQEDSVIYRANGTDTRVRFGGANPHAGLDAADPLPGKLNFLLGRDAASWRANIPTYGKLRYRSLYAGIDLIFAETGGRAKSDFVVQPRADPGEIRLEFPDAQSLRIDTDGTLVVQTDGREWREAAPQTYQEAGSGKAAIESRYRLLDPHSVGFEIGTYDRSRALIVDPAVLYSTYFGGSLSGAVTGVAADAAGNVYVTGWTESINFPTASALQPRNRGDVDAFVAKLNAAGTALVYSTYIGGSGDDRGAAVAVDPAGQVYVTGATSSEDFPVSSPLRLSLGGSRDAFAAKLNAAGSAFVYCTYLGGTNWDQGDAIAADASGDAYIAGDTQSSDFPTAQAAQSALAGQIDAFAAKLGPSGGLLYSTYLGGAGNEHAGGIAVDSTGAAYVAGGTYSTNFPVVNALQGTNAGGQDAFATKISSTGSSFLYSTYLGGASGGSTTPEEANAIAVDGSGNAYLAGVTNSANFPVTAGSLRTVNNSIQDAFAAKLNPAGNALVYSTFVGGSVSNWASGIAIDANGDAFLAGTTSSVDFPQNNALQGFGGEYDAFLAELNPSGAALLFSTFYGGSGADGASGIALDPGGDIFAGGQTGSQDFPLATPLQSSYGGQPTGWILRLAGPPASVPSVVGVSPATGSGLSQTFTFTFSDSAGWQSLGVIDILIRDVLDGIQACYFAYVVQNGALVLVNDAGGGYVTGYITLGGTGALSNSQCSIASAGSSATGSGSTLTLTLNMSFTPAFAGNKVMYLAARDTGTGNSGWQSMGTWNIPGPAPAGPAVGGVSPARSVSAGQTYTFTFTDTNGFRDLAVLDVLINGELDGISACYFALAPSPGSNGGSLYLVADVGGGYAGIMPVGGAGSISNSQCSLNGAGASITESGNTLTLMLPITFSPGFAGNQIFFVAARSNTQNSGWQPVGSVTVP